MTGRPAALPLNMTGSVSCCDSIRQHMLMIRYNSILGATTLKTIALITLTAALSLVHAQGQSTALTLQDAVREALDKYPAVRGSLEQVSAAAAGIELARTAYLPRADVLWQSNRATHNNVFGLPPPQPILPPLSGRT